MPEGATFHLCVQDKGLGALFPAADKQPFNDNTVRQKATQSIKTKKIVPYLNTL